MALTAYSIKSCGTTYEYHTTRSHHDRLATDLRSESSTLHHVAIHTRRTISEALYRHISLIDSVFTPPPETRSETPSRRLYKGN